MASIHTRHGMYYVHWRGSDGKQRKKSLGTRDKNEAARRFVKWEGYRDRPNERVDCTPDQFWCRFAPLREKSVARNTFLAEQFTWKEFLEYFRPSSLGTVSQSSIEQYVLDRSATLSPKSINNFLGNMRLFYNKAATLTESNGTPLYTLGNKFSASVIPRVRGNSSWKQRKPYLGESEIERLLDQADQQSADMFLFCVLGLYQGFRKNEILNAKWEWFKERVTIPADADFSPKSGRSRDMPYFRTTKELIEPYRRLSGYVCCPEKSSGKQYRWDNTTAFKRILQRADLMNIAPYGHPQKVTPHVLRHTWASHLLKNGETASRPLPRVSSWPNIRRLSIYVVVLESARTK